jgi:hypothetical protein
LEKIKAYLATGGIDIASLLIEVIFELFCKIKALIISDRIKIVYKKTVKIKDDIKCFVLPGLTH